MTVIFIVIEITAELGGGTLKLGVELRKWWVVRLYWVVVVESGWFYRYKNV